MRISELSSATGVAVASIKYYLREGLLPQGELTSANQASYSESHAQRLRLIRALLGVGRLPIATAKEVIAAIDTPGLPLTWVFGIAQRAISDSSLYEPVEGETEGTRAVAATIEARAWRVSPDNPGVYGAARVIDTYTRVGHPELATIGDGYAEAAELIAKADLASVAQHKDVQAMSETVVVGTILGDALVSSLRRMAQEHISNQQFPATSKDPS